MRSGANNDGEGRENILVTTVDPLAAQVRKAFAVFFIS
jgi:hypothetical protein